LKKRKALREHQMPSENSRGHQRTGEVVGEENYSRPSENHRGHERTIGPSENSRGHKNMGEFIGEGKGLQRQP
jgi:hypothetical protein